MAEANLFRRQRERSIVRSLMERSASGKCGKSKIWAEDKSVSDQQFTYLPLSADTTRSTIALAFSSDGIFLASTHGDHTVKVTDFFRGRVVQTLRGHPRTPWTVKFHPRDSRIVASGCLGYEVRIWNTATGQCLHATSLDAAIISVSFHPSGSVLAIASGQFVYLWDYNNKGHPVIAWSHTHTLRCVCFTPGGDGIIVGAANNSPSAPQPQQQQQQQEQQRTVARVTTAEQRANATHASTWRARAPSRSAQAEVTFGLQVWSFDLEATLAGAGTGAMTKPLKILDKALLYNDGGFDVSQDGLWLCAIGELERAVGVADPAAQPMPPAAMPIALAEGVEGRGRGVFARAELGRGQGGGTSADSQCATESHDWATSVSKKDDGTKHGLARKDGEMDVCQRDGLEPACGQGGTAVGVHTLESDSKTGNDGEWGDGAAPKHGSQHAGGSCPGPQPGLAQRRQQEAWRGPKASSSNGSVGVLAPWPSRIRPRRPRAGTGVEQPLRTLEFDADASAQAPRIMVIPCLGSTATTREVASRIAEAFSPATPHPLSPAPSPSSGMTLKRPLSSSRSGVNGERWSGGRQRRSPSWASAIERAEETRRRARLGLEVGPERVGGRADGGSLSGVSMDAVVASGEQSIPNGMAPQEAQGSTGPGRDRVECERTQQQQQQQQQQLDRPPPLPPPPAPREGLLTASAATAATAAAAASSAAMTRRCRSSPSSSPLSRGLKISLPLLLPPPPMSQQRQLPSASNSSPELVRMSALTSASVTATSANHSTPGEAAVRHSALQSDQTAGQQPSPFFLRVPHGSALPPNSAVGMPQTPEADEGTHPTTRLGHICASGTDHREHRPQDQDAERCSEAAGSTSTSTSTSTSRRRDHRRSDHRRSVAAEPEPRNAKDSERVLAQLRPSQQPSAPRPGPHLVLVSLRHASGSEGGAARVVRAAAMDRAAARQVTSVKLSPSARYILLGAGVRAGRVTGSDTPHEAVDTTNGAGSALRNPATSVYHASDLQPANLMPKADHDVNIACFHPEAGMGCVYGTKQGRLCLVRAAGAVDQG